MLTKAMVKAMEMEHLPAVPEKTPAEYEVEIDALKQEPVRRTSHTTRE